MIGVKRSAPRPPGSKMAVNEHGEISGAVSGGCVEGAVVEVAEQVLSGGDAAAAALRHRRRGGVGRRAAVRRRDRRLGGALRAVSAAGEFTDLARRGGRGALVTVLSGPAAGGKLLVARRRRRAAARSATPPLEEAAAQHARRADVGRALRAPRRGRGVLFVDATFPPPRLIAFGAVDFAAALCRLARAAGWRPFVVDPRARFAQPARFPDAEEVVAAWPEEAFAQLGGIDRATAIAVLTHDPKLDDAALIIALRSNAGYIGAMGSRRAQASRRERLLAKGVTDEEMERICGADRARPRRADRRGDRALDHGRDRRHAARARRRPARARAGPDPRGRRVTDRRADPRRRRGAAVRRDQAARRAGRSAAARARARRGRGAVAARGRARPRGGRDPSRPSTCTARAVVVCRTGTRARRRRCAAALAALGGVDAVWSCSATSRGSRRAAVDA